MTAQWGKSCEKLVKDGESLSESNVTGATFEVPIHEHILQGKGREKNRNLCRLHRYDLIGAYVVSHMTHLTHT